MKTYLFSILLLSALHVSGQDIIHLHTGRTLNVKIDQVGENSVQFTYPTETVKNTLGKAAIDKIVFASGRSEHISDRIEVNGKDGWKKVMITNNPNEIVGLTRRGEIKAKAGGYWSMRTTKGSDRKATERIKREAVELGGHVVYLQQHETKGRGFYSNPESIQSGVAYGY